MTSKERGAMHRQVENESNANAFLLAFTFIYTRAIDDQDVPTPTSPARSGNSQALPKVLQAARRSLPIRRRHPSPFPPRRIRTVLVYFLELFTRCLSRLGSPW